MEEENKPNQQEVNASHTDVEKEIEELSVASKPKKEFFTVKFWLVALTIVFSLSLLSGAYLVFSGTPLNASKQQAITLADAEESANSAIKMLTKNAKEGGAAIIKVRGVIQEGQDSGFSSRQSASAIAKRIRTLADKKEVKALLLDINSPGGTVAAVQDIYNAINYFRAQKKPVVALFRDVAASGGFYIAMAADKIIAQPGTMTGSIGVIMQTTNVEGLFEKIGVRIIPIKSGKHKDMGSSYRPLTEEEIALLQEMIADTYQQFFNAVKEGRPNIPVETLRLYADGRIFTGARAKALGLIDDLGGEEKAKEYLIQMTGDKDLKLLAPRPSNVMDILLLSGGLDSKLGLSGKLEEITSPRVSYLWTY
ncbi:MAG: signal peptide peptidase SppA [Elusimicrobiota bacterium]|jgi:protease-4|nr:signal peptide peptidase SppA [Elusimicrobiota bacterium]